MSGEPPKRVMAIMAHPDDADFTAAGTIAQWTDQGWQITYVMCTRGDKGTNDPNVSPEEIAAIREKEAQDAAAELGVTTCVFLPYKDGELEVTMAFRRELAGVLRLYKPDILLTHDPWRHYQIHPDHRATGFSALDAVAAARDRLYFPEQIAAGLASHRVKEVYLWTPESPNLWIDISDTFDRKVATLRRHVSQVSRMPDLEKRLRQWAEAAASGHGMKLAEVYRRLELT
jgi:LmbE family N-acetylglucosaminyl deacetylase